MQPAPTPPSRPGTQVPAATRTLRVLRFLAGQPDPVPVDRIARACDLPRSTAYHLLGVMVEEGFVTHLPEEHLYGLGVAAFEVGSGYARQVPLQRIARRALATLVDRTGHNAHLAVLHGRDVLYVLEERAPGRPPLVTDVGVRLPAHLTASGRALLAGLSAAQVRAIFPGPEAMVERTGLGPRTPRALKELLVATRQRGHATEDGEVSEGMASVAAAVRDHNEHPVAGVALTYPVAEVAEAAGAGGVAGPATVERLAGEVRRTADQLTRRLGGGRAR